jgi:O-antigen/teichoic acid export membrane protein
MSFSSFDCAVLLCTTQVGTRYLAKGSFRMEIESRLKIALDESRLLILGAQVLFGFQFAAVFRELFPNIPADSRYIHCAGLVMLLISVGLLIAPSLFHQIIFQGERQAGAIATATVLAGASLLPLTIGLGAAAFVTFEHLFSRGYGIAAGTSFTIIALGLLYGLGFALRRDRRNPMPEKQNRTPLRSRIEQI